MAGKWITKIEYARRYGISPAAVTKAIQANRLPVKKFGKKELVDGTSDITQNREAARNPSGVSLEKQLNSVQGKTDVADRIFLQLQIARLEKIKSDTEVQKNKLEIQAGETLRQHLTEFYEIFRDAFLEFKITVQKINLNDDQIEALNNALDNCINNMEIDALRCINEAEKKD